LALALLVGLASPAFAWELPPSLLVWQAAMCDYTAKLQADTAMGKCVGAGGACGRIDEQPERMCITPGGRAEQIKSACRASNLHAAATYNAMTASSWLHHVGLLAEHVRGGKMPLALYYDNMGDDGAPNPLLFRSLTEAKSAIRAYARAIFHPLVPPAPRALSGYGWTLYRQGMKNLCTDR
jgi:hypothetical protein